MLKNHEWRYLKSGGRDVFIDQFSGGKPYGGEPYYIKAEEEIIEKEIFEHHFENEEPPEFVIEQPNLLHNSIHFEDHDQEINIGYLLRWER